MEVCICRYVCKYIQEPNVSRMKEVNKVGSIIIRRILCCSFQ